ncbi:MAG TPA: DinB family protein [Thermoanaerobaculia bacterium]|nr:DinB family protein [Thermoanaerobaculia bacterium]
MPAAAHPFRLEEAVALLERTPDVLRGLLDGLPESWVRATEGDGKWSPYDVVGHLIHGERTDWIPRARHILAEERRPFERFDREAQFRESRGKSLRELLETFARLRRESLDALEAMHLGEADLARTGTHPELGVVTLAQLLSTWTVHDLDHVAQIVRTMAKAYGDAVGPWTAYLSVLHDREG